LASSSAPDHSLTVRIVALLLAERVEDLLDHGLASRGVDLANLSDEELLAELRAAQQGVVETPDRVERRAAWQRVMDATRELERRYPIATEPLT
jgi:hypothetical protein